MRVRHAKKLGALLSFKFIKKTATRAFQKDSAGGHRDE